MIRLATTAEGKAKAATEASKLLAENPGGVRGALLAEAVRDAEPKVQPAASAAALRKQLVMFNTDWFGILNNPRAFYVIRPEPIKILHAYGEPVMVAAVIQNITDHAITIGDPNDAAGQNGILSPGLWFDASASGLLEKKALNLEEKQFPGAAYELLTGQLVLKPRQAMTKYIRLDQGDLGRFLMNNPTPDISIDFLIRTNPGRGLDGRMGSAPGGYLARVSRTMSRTGSPEHEEAVKKAIAGAQSGDPAARMRYLDLLAHRMDSLLGAKDDPSAQKQAGDLMDTLKKVSADTDVTVRAYASYLCAMRLSLDQRSDLVQKMATDAAWQSQILALVAAGEMGEKQRPMVEQISKREGFGFVKEYAAALIELAKAPATRPVGTP
jgi:hypothetical protein